MALKAEKVKVDLKYNSSSKRYSITINKVAAWVGTKKLDEVTWISKNADLKVDFNKNGCPFIAQTLFGPAGIGCSSGAAQYAYKQAYGYTLTITPNPQISNGSVGLMTPIIFDPQVVVDDDGPPGGGRRKAAKKKAAKKKAGKKRARRRR